MTADSHDPLYVEGCYFRDDWGCLWYNAQDGILGQVIEHPLESWADMKALVVPDPAAQADWPALKEAVRIERERGLPAVAFPESFAHGGLFDRLQFLRGLENLLVDFVLEPAQLQELIDRVLAYNMKYIDLWLENEIDVIWFHGDIGTQGGPLISPPMFRRYLKPAYTEMFRKCREAGVHVWYSSDGNILELIDDLVECGVSIHDPQVSANGIEGIARVYRGKLCAMVDIDEQMLPFCSPKEIHRQIGKAVEKIGTSAGGLMFFASPSNDVPLENIEAICDAWERYCYFELC